MNCWRFVIFSVLKPRTDKGGGSGIGNLSRPRNPSSSIWMSMRPMEAKPEFSPWLLFSFCFQMLRLGNNAFNNKILQALLMGNKLG